MLVLARKEEESIVIGENIVVKVIAVENGGVKLGIEAPNDVKILRSELIEEVKEQNRAALHQSDAAEIDALGKILGKK